MGLPFKGFADLTAQREMYDKRLAEQQEMWDKRLAEQQEEIKKSLHQCAAKCREEFSGLQSASEKQFKERIGRLKQEALEYKEKSPQIYNKLMEEIEHEEKFYRDFQNQMKGNLTATIDFILGKYRC